MQTAEIFVTTYGVGNEQGFACGKWFDLTDYSEKDNFLEAATQYARQELGDNDPELCFPDYEGEAFLDGKLYSECSLSKAIFDIISLDSSDYALLLAYTNATGEDITDVADQLSRAQDYVVGEYEDDEAFAYEMVSDSYNLDDMPGFLTCHINWSGVARDLMMDYVSADGYYFRSH